MAEIMAAKVDKEKYTGCEASISECPVVSEKDNGRSENNHIMR